MSQPPEDPIKALWQGQETEIPTMTVQTLRMLVKDNAASQRRQATYGLAVAVVVVAISIWTAWTAPTTLLRLGDLALLAWAPVTLWMIYRRWPGRAPGAEASAQGLVDFYRAQIVRQAPDLWLIALALAPVAVSVALIVAGVWEKASRMHPSPLWLFAALLAAWAVAATLQFRRQQRRVRDRLRELDALRG